MISFDMQDPGFKELMENLEKFKNSIIKGADLRSKSRTGIEGTSTNIDNNFIVNELIRDGRDFFSLDDTGMKRVVKAGEEALEKRTKNLTPEKLEELSEKGTVVWRSVFEAILTEWCTIITENIEEQKGSPKQLTPEYRKWKLKEAYGDKIGKLTGQLLDNVSPKAVRRNIQYRK
jgi:hypothetical protein